MKKIQNSEGRVIARNESYVAIQGKFRILRENAVVRSRQVMEQKFWVRIDYEGGSAHSLVFCKQTKLRYSKLTEIEKHYRRIEEYAPKTEIVRFLRLTEKQIIKKEVGTNSHILL